MATEPTYTPKDPDIPIKELILDIQKWVRYLWSKWLILLIAGLLGGGVGLWYAIVKKPVYTATTTFVLEASDSKSGLGRLAGMAAIAGIDVGGNAGGLFQGNNILELYRSRKMLEKSLLSKVQLETDELLIERYIAFNGIKEVWEARPDLLTLDFHQDPASLIPQERRLRDSVLTSFISAIRKDILTVEKVENLSIIQVDVASQDEIFSKEFNERLVKEVNEFYTQTKTKKSVDNIAILQQKADSVRAVMTGAIYDAAHASDITPNINPTRQVQRIVPTQQAQFSAETNKEVLNQLQQNLELAKMSLLQEQPLIQLVDQPVFPLKVDRLGKVKGTVIGGFFFGFLALLVLIGRKYIRDVMDTA
ncbi:Wzz/FepE/Etk N-terminal domain-containing protein [Parapedobacter sp. 10938]|uniref:Wzz/FepE/Etk N-terminal domain-containing protein n=1 Tax=Parapedobacter flavus TaxID=3110225 RepID=UPI002DC046E0|nr:Wzz/FepE/Etk N-terminal domain-containing protein [Parapedobacter sp. 10938]MEC3880151.1 Wzz/FepE/Etk N-terminal domain-containing protein [Parapedobacter sp. 10938]